MERDWKLRINLFINDQPFWYISSRDLTELIISGALSISQRILSANW